MKKLKIKKRMTSFLMLVAMAVSIVGVLPKSVAYADDTLKLPDFDFRIDDNKMDGSFQLFKWNPSCAGADTVSFWNPEKKEFCDAVISTSPLTDSYTYYKYSATTDGGSILMNKSENKCHSGSFVARGKKYYFVWYENKISNLDYGIGVKRGICFGSKEFVTEDSEKRICEYIIGTLPTSFTVIGENGVDTDSVPDGSENNPLLDKDIGTIIIKSHAFIPVKNNVAYPLLPQTDDSTFAYYRFKYKDKTSSGFSISNNKYARTFIQVRVQNQCVLLDPNDRNVIKEFYKHYGEFYQYKNIPTENISDNIFKVSWDDITLKWSDFTEHPNSTNKKLAYRFMIRVICTDSLTVIPDEKSGWHAGGWRSIVFDGSNFVEETNGHVKNDGTWTDDKDDGHNNSSDKTTDVPKTEDEANDSMNDNSSNSSTNFVDKLKQAKNAFDTANEYIKQVLKVPTMLGKLFSFFPDWVLYPFEFAFALIPWIIIYKLLRG